MYDVVFQSPAVLKHKIFSVLSIVWLEVFYSLLHKIRRGLTPKEWGGDLRKH